MALALAMSLEIEAWQYYVYTGFAQATDVLCNTLGCAVGALPWLVTEGLCLRRAGDCSSEVER
jgi:glycopeptide antibiotics resistance protein